MVLRYSPLIPCTGRSVGRRAAWRRRGGQRKGVSSQRRVLCHVVVGVQAGHSTLAHKVAVLHSGVGLTSAAPFAPRCEAVPDGELLARFSRVHNRGDILFILCAEGRKGAVARKVKS